MTLIRPNLDQLLGIRDTAGSGTNSEKPSNARTTNGSRSSGVMSLPTGAAITLLAALTTGTYTSSAMAEVPRNATEVSQLLSQLKGENGENTWDTRAGDFNNIPDKLVKNLSPEQKALFLEMGLKFAIDTYSSQAVKDTFTQKFGMAETVFNEKVKAAINNLVSDLEAESEDSPIWDKHGDKFNSIQDWAVKLLDPPDLERFLKVGLINDFDTYSSQAVKDTFTQKFGMTPETFDQTVTSIKGDSETGAEDGAGDGGESAAVANPAIQAELDTARTTIQQQNQTITTLQEQNRTLQTQLRGKNQELTRLTDTEASHTELNPLENPAPYLYGGGLLAITVLTGWIIKRRRAAIYDTENILTLSDREKMLQRNPAQEMDKKLRHLAGINDGRISLKDTQLLADLNRLNQESGYTYQGEDVKAIVDIPYNQFDPEEHKGLHNEIQRIFPKAGLVPPPTV